MLNIEAIEPTLMSRGWNRGIYMDYVCLLIFFLIKLDTFDISSLTLYL